MAFGRKLPEWGKKSQTAGSAGFVLLRSSVMPLHQFFSLSGCYDPLVALQSSRFGAAQALYRLRESTFNLSKVHRGFALPKPAATQAEAVFGVSGHGPSVHCSPTLARPGGCWARFVSGGSWAPPWCGASSVPAFSGAPDPRPSLGVCLWPRPCPVLGGCRMRPMPGRRPRLSPGDRYGDGNPCPPAGALARPICQPTLGLSALGPSGL